MSSAGLVFFVSQDILHLLSAVLIVMYAKEIKKSQQF